MKLRFVHKPENPNIGFTDAEIELISSRNFINPESIFVQFLANAGKKSNVFDTDFKDVDAYFEFQETFRKLLKSDSEVTMDVSSLYCFHIHKDYYNNINYYFIDAKESKDSEYFYYSNGSVPIGVNFRDERTQKIGLVKRKETFGNHLNYETELKFGPSVKGKIIQFLMATLTFPIWLPILIGFKINDLRKRF